MKIPDEKRAGLWRAVTGYGLAVVLVSSGVAASLLLRQYGSNRPFLIFLFASVLASGWFGGIGPGWFAVIFATTLVDYYYIPPRFHFSADARDIPWLVAFVICAAVGNILATRQRKANIQLEEARNNLERRVIERTAELECTNENLKSEMNERTRAETALRDARLELERVARLTTMGEFTASIAHEISQPLASIGVNATAGLRWIDGAPANLDEARSAFRRIERDRERATKIIARIRGLVRRAGAEEAPLDLNTSIRDVLNLVHSSLSALGIHIQLRLAEKLPRVVGDRVALEQVLLNLIVNAKDAMTAERSGRRTLTLHSGVDDAGNVVVRVGDTGGGIDSELRDQVFAPFFTTKQEGMGLGLSICKSIIQQHGGRIWVQTDTDGTTFAFSLTALTTNRTSSREAV